MKISEMHHLTSTLIGYGSCISSNAHDKTANPYACEHMAKKFTSLLAADMIKEYVKFELESYEYEADSVAFSRDLYKKAATALDVIINAAESEC